WRKAFYFFQMHRDEFEAKYHARSNVESVFSALKRKFGETLRSRTPTAQTNELLAKILAYNLTVLIHEIFEHGVVPDFLREPAPGSTPAGEVVGQSKVV
ncbi:MAG: transposase, partial [Thermoplasmatales archaeon]|nr:transposase [Thermoplasmatales archaeon]